MITQKEMLAHFLPIFDKSGRNYQKKSLIKAKKAQPGLQVVTKTSDGIETKNTAEKGDWLVENQTSSNEQYLVKAETFAKKYRLLQSLEQGWGCYEPIGRIIGLEAKMEYFEAFPKAGEVRFEAPWKDSMIIREGDFLVVPPEKDEIYRVAKKEFLETYKEI
ncbi:PGDYG domain-containing protein [Algoriphagus halophytocola]|uniref:PGDYG domain-containing protein n=1 Tax=Algoriphagus halophytocola TaxID=2991499 RepID=A0ABY6MK89_9BACT|nr:MULTISPECIES: PGDYG domain-containing protein [unclassified Algoriphagus]UZD23593.1 PGDYG domain-containing protein [Algoriphagus sp. TR-M5]WBL44886.1 PGDYG domain-containing protein [Algoriphagus sp. TR-M9]